MSHMNQDEVMKALEATGLRPPAPVAERIGTNTVSDPDSKVRELGVEDSGRRCRDAKRYGATSVLFVPAVVNKTFPTPTPTSVRKRKSARPFHSPRNSV